MICKLDFNKVMKICNILFREKYIRGKFFLKMFSERWSKVYCVIKFKRGIEENVISEVW